jgi:hypothetical protein
MACAMGWILTPLRGCQRLRTSRRRVLCPGQVVKDQVYLVDNISKLMLSGLKRAVKNNVGWLPCGFRVEALTPTLFRKEREKGWGTRPVFLSPG